MLVPNSGTSKFQPLPVWHSHPASQCSIPDGPAGPHGVSRLLSIWVWQQVQQIKKFNWCSTHLLGCIEYILFSTNHGKFGRVMEFGSWNCVPRCLPEKNKKWSQFTTDTQNLFEACGTDFGHALFNKSATLAILGVQTCMTPWMAGHGLRMAI